MSRNHFVALFDKLSRRDVASAGGKGASLGEMTQAGIPVPEGFVVLSNAFEQFISTPLSFPTPIGNPKNKTQQKKKVIASRAERDVAISDVDLRLNERLSARGGSASGTTSQNLAMTIGEYIERIFNTVDRNDIKSVEQASERIRSLILNTQMPEAISQEVIESFSHLDCKYVAVRSSATAEDSSSAAWAGQLESYLNTTKENLLENVKKCWASLFTPRAIFYRFETFGKPNRGSTQIKTQMDADEDISVAVVVQKMIQSEVSGIAFSVHPVTQDRNQMIIEAGCGLGEAIVSGQITPDSYVVGKSSASVIPDSDPGSKKKKKNEKDLTILERNTSQQERMLVRKVDGGTEWNLVPRSDQNKQKLSDSEIIELSELILRIENHYGFPVDVEFAREGGKFYIVQSRPITTLQKRDSHQKLVFEVEYRREASISMFYIWYYGHIYAFRELLKLDPLPAEKVFAVYKDGVWEAYTQKDNLNKIKWRIKELDLDDLEKVIDRYLSDFSSFTDNTNLVTDKSFLERLTGEFVVNFILGDLAEHPLQVKALTAREKTEKLFYLFWEALKERFQWKHFEVYSYDEVLSDTRLDSQSIELRKMSLLNAQGVTIIKDFQTELKIYLKKKDLEIFEEKGHNHIVGQVAMTGMVTGVVKLIFKKKDIYKIGTGDILVTSMTTPDFVPAMKLAGGFITDEGGITSHAAIIAREMKKPCIIGTKIATKALKDGDLVEVDANKGVVRILERVDKHSDSQSKQRTVMVRSEKYYKGAKSKKSLLSGINLQNYDFIFRIGLNYFFNSFWFTGEYLDRDFILCSVDNTMTLYVSKAERRRLSDIGYNLYTNGFKKFKQRIQGQLLLNKKFLAQEKNKKLNTLSNRKLATEFKKAIGFCERAWRLYFWTEYFCFDKIANVIQGASNEQSRILKKNLDEIARLKLLQRKSFLNSTVYGGSLEKYCQEIAKRFQLKIPVTDYHYQELLDLLQGNDVNVPDRHIYVRGRLFAHKDLYGEDAKAVIETLEGYEKDSDVLRGQTGNRGFYKGRVRKIAFSIETDFIKEIGKMKKGDVLVSGSTGPELMLACKKAGAIVTDEGGIISHATIISRELNIPSVIGTKIATKVLKDGDLVEVDANNGVVKILKRAK